VQRLGLLRTQVELENASGLPFVAADGYFPELFRLSPVRSLIFHIGRDIRSGSCQVVGRPLHKSAAFRQIDVLIFLYRYLLVSREVLRDPWDVRRQAVLQYLVDVCVARGFDPASEIDIA
jgi:hypothetical protein